MHKYTNKDSSQCTCHEVRGMITQLKDVIVARNAVMFEILGEHKALLNKILNQNNAVGNIVQIFPICSEEKLEEFDKLLETQSELYVRHMRSLLRRNAKKYLMAILDKNLLLGYNLDGTHGKRRTKENSKFNRI